jgi:hypothetical protein
MPLGFSRSVLLKSGYIPSDYEMYLDAGLSASYPGTGTTWYDLSSNNYDWIVREADYSTNDGGSFIFNDGGIAVRSTDVPLNYTNTTFVVALRWRSGGTDWRTLTRGNSADHHVMVQNNTVNLGMYDNNNAGFLDSGYNIDQTPNYTTKYNIHIWEFKNTSPYYVYYENGVYKSQITDVRAAPNNGFRCIGGYHGGQVNAGITSQQAGDVAAFVMYHRLLTQSEKDGIYNYYKLRFGI